MAIDELLDTPSNAHAYTYDATPGTAEPSKAVVLDENKNYTGINNLTLNNLTFGGNFTYGSTVLSETELKYLDDITPGTVSASKVLICDASKDLSGLNDLGIVGTLTASSANINGTLACDTSITIDAITLLTAELEVLDGVTTGTSAASKALVLDANSDLASGTLRDLLINRTLKLPTDGALYNMLNSDASGNASWGSIPRSIVPSYDFSNYSEAGLNNYLNSIRVSSEVEVVKYTHGTGIGSAYSYSGSVYCPIKNRVYFVPNGIGDEATWHYVNCADGTIVGYVHGATVVNNAYLGGVYSPTQKRIYFVPHNQGPETDWHYIDCTTGNVVSYAHSSTSQGSVPYAYGVYSPTQNRIYLMPWNRVYFSTWHYIDCSDGSVVAYANGISPAEPATAFYGGVYSPTQNRIYLVPYALSDDPTWYYINCSDGSVVGYANGLSGLSGLGYRGGVYSPTQNRIYLVPAYQAQYANWHYIDCNDGSVVAYAHGTTGYPNHIAFSGGAYMPTSNRIYFAPAYSYSMSDLPYINCDDGTVGTYVNNLSLIFACYVGATYSPTDNTIYFTPWGDSTNPTWIKVQDKHNIFTQTSKVLMSGALFNI